MNLCRGCGEDFGSVAAFDRHRSGVHAYTFREGLDRDPPVEDGRRCLDRDEMRAKGMSVNGRGRWQIDAHAEHARRRFGTPSSRRGLTESASEGSGVRLTTPAVKGAEISYLGGSPMEPHFDRGKDMTMIYKTSTLPDLKQQAAFCDELRAGKDFVQAAAAIGYEPEVFAFLAMTNASFAGDVNTELRRFGTDVLGPDGWLRLIESSEDAAA